jgi:hypothetical protein
MLRRAQALQAEPEFYNTFANNCATNLRTHVNRTAAEPLPFGWGILFPGYSDELALERGLLATDLPLEAARATGSTSAPRLRSRRERQTSRAGFGRAPERSWPLHGPESGFRLHGARKSPQHQGPHRQSLNQDGKHDDRVGHEDQEITFGDGREPERERHGDPSA